jgi:hypothetical protein
MSGHPLLPQTKERTSSIVVAGNIYNIHLSYHKAASISGHLVGIKFTDKSNSMNPAKKAGVNGAQLGIAIGQRAMQMVEPDLDNIAVLGFYLLTEDLEKRGEKAVRVKKRVYSSTALKIHSHVKHRLPIIRMLEASGGIGWAMSRDNFSQSSEYEAFVRLLGKQLEVSDVNSTAE